MVIFINIQNKITIIMMKQILIGQSVSVYQKALIPAFDTKQTL